MEELRAEILFVDDSGELSAAAEPGIAGVGANLRRAANLADAQRRIHEHHIDLVVLGAKALSEPAERLSMFSQSLRQRGGMLAISGAEGDAEQMRQGMELGARQFLPWPAADAQILGERLYACLELCRQEAGPGEQALDSKAFKRLNAEIEDLRRRLMEQIRSFEGSQETFYLDLSRMMTIISNIMDGIVFVDRSESITLMNPVAEELLGMKAFLAIGKRIDDVEEDGELVDALVRDYRAVQTEGDQCRTVEVHSNDQDLRYIKVNTSRVLDYKGDFAGTLTVLQDITNEYKSDQLKNQYLSIVAHELRTPLTGIKTFSTMMSKGSLGDLTEHQKNAVESIREQSIRLEHQIDKLINLGYLDSNDYAQDPEVMSIRDLVEAAAQPFELAAKDAGVELCVELDVGDECVKVDRTDIKRALKSLIENAVKFTAEGGRVRISASLAGGRAHFEVADSGIGIDPRYQRRIFEKFFQVEDPLTRHHGGAGLGLFVASGVLEAHDSKIEVRSALGQGATFSFDLPLFDEETATLAASGHASAD